ncbi:MAG: YkgJ family cysteine cluster protein [Thermodesulfobacteriota bacterium]
MGTKKNETKEPVCRRCGTCCRKSTPALHEEDIIRIGRSLAWEHLCTLRLGEMAFDNVEGRLKALEAEIVKLRSLPGSAECVLFSSTEGCQAYQDRPQECRVLFCEEPEALAAMYEKGRITRMDLLSGAPALADAVRMHEERCPQREVPALCRKARTQDSEAVSALLGMAALDAAIRKFLVERGAAREEWLLFLLGRPFPETIAPFGLSVRESGGVYALETTRRI